MYFTDYSMNLPATDNVYNVVGGVSDPFGYERNRAPYTGYFANTQYVTQSPPHPGFHYPHPGFVYEAPRYDQYVGPSYDQYVDPFASVSIGSNAPAEVFTEHVNDTLYNQQTTPQNVTWLTSPFSSNEMFDKNIEISHPAVGIFGTGNLAAIGTQQKVDPSPSRAADGRVPCHNNCGLTFTLPQDANRHCEHSCVLSARVTCYSCPIAYCGRSLSRKDALSRHLVDVHHYTKSHAKRLAKEIATKR